MKTLKILTGVVIVALIVVFATGMVDFSENESDNLYADNPANTESSDAYTNNGQELATAEQISTKSGYDIGDKATDFSLMNVDDKKVSLKDYEDAKGFIVIFTTNHCPYSVAYEDRINELDKKYKEKGYPVIAINPNNPKSYPEDSFENMKIRAKEKGFTFPYLLDNGQKIYPQYGATKTPHVFLLQKENGDNIVKYIGAIDDNYKDASAVKNRFVEAAVDALLANQEIEKKKTVAIGCSIKR